MRWILLCALLTLCDREEDDDPPAQPPSSQITINVTASSNPSGAHVTGGGRSLGNTPLQVDVPVPPPQPGQTQSFQFTFTMPGYEPQTITATPVNNTISIAANMVALNGDPV